MLTKFAAALLATSLIAGSALAAQTSGTPAAKAPAPQSQTLTTPVGKATTASKTVKHTARHRSHVRKHVARNKSHVVHHARHATKTHQARMNKGNARS